MIELFLGLASLLCLGAIALIGLAVLIVVQYSGSQVSKYTEDEE